MEKRPSDNKLKERDSKFNLKSYFGVLLMGFWVLAGAIATGSSGPWVQWLERQTQTLFFKLRGSVPVPENLIILAIDDESLSAAPIYADDPQGEAIADLLATWPWKRAAYGKAIERLMAAGAKSVAVDVIFSTPSIYGDADDRQFQEVLQRYADRVTLAALYRDSPTPTGNLVQLVKPYKSLETTPMSVGFINYLPESDGKIHSLGTAYLEEVVRPLDLTTLPSFDRLALESAEISYPEPKGRDIFFYGPSGSFPKVPFWHVLYEDWWEIHLKEKTFQDKVVLIGATANSLQDFFTTPFRGKKMAGVEIHTHAIATLQEGKSIKRALPTGASEGIFVLVAVALAAVLIDKMPKQTLARLSWGFGLAIGWGCISYVLFAYAQTIMPAAVPVVAIAAIGFCHFTIGAIGDQRSKKRFRRTLERYLAAPIVEEILKQPDDYKALLKGGKIKAAVLFCDIRGFTNLSSHLSPEVLVEQLNIYLDAMVEAILAADGTLDKFIGDAVMAEFGSPVSQGEKTDAMNAIRAALEMRRALARLREQWQQEGRVPLFNGIGINYGELIAGNIGSWRRMEYAVIGDTVNVASRIEGLTKKVGVDILIAESLYKLVAEEVEAVFIGDREVRGREGSVRLYSLVGRKGNPEDKKIYQQVREEMEEMEEFLTPAP